MSRKSSSVSSRTNFFCILKKEKGKDVNICPKKSPRWNTCCMSIFMFLLVVLLLKSSCLFCQSITFFNSPLVYGRIIGKKTLVWSLPHVLFDSSFSPLVSVFWEYYLVVQACLNSVNWKKSFLHAHSWLKSRICFSVIAASALYAVETCIYIHSDLSCICIFDSVSWEEFFVILHFEMQLT